MKATIFYFSGTGNTRYIARRFCKKMNNKEGNEFSAFSIEEQADIASLFNKSVIGFCYPIYGSNVPRIMREFVAKYKELLNNKKLIILCTQVMFSGDGARVFMDDLKGIKCDVILAEHFNMPNNIDRIPIFKIKNGVENKKIIIKANRRLSRICRILSAGKIFKRGFNKFSHGLGLIQRPLFKIGEQIAKKSVKIDNDCICCGLCVKSCPMDNLEIRDAKIAAKDNCTLCYRCVNICPKQAITTLINQKPKKQYKGMRYKN